MEEAGFVATKRLDLRPLPAAAYGLIAEGEQARAEELLGISLDASRLAGLAPFVRWRMAQLERDPSELPWLIHLMILRSERVVAGDIGFHGPPDAGGFVEIGYTVNEPYRGRGLATEAARGMATWAAGQGARGLRASISPENEPSLKLAARLGLTQVGSQMDAIDGLELVFERRFGRQ